MGGRDIPHNLFKNKNYENRKKINQRIFRLYN